MYQQTMFLQAGEELQVDNGSLSMGTVYETEINSTIDFVFKYDTLISKEESGGYTHHASSTLEIELTGQLDFDISIYWDRINNPTIDENGDEPEKDDYRLVFGVSYTY
ncbi:hypothetical protein MNBD_GAMMA08-2993 [hydrothermal vent metagenome]|uniref:DUF481 domain-containing protein n=1 Tax=hydrothermal vent metagenome TaxID=652676 RepID=A0A3B0XTR8_9ZZZZ